MIIEWNVDIEGTLDGRIDPGDLCGGIIIIREHQQISDPLVYLEDWFDCLIDGYEKLMQGSKFFECDLISEGDLLQFSVKNKLVKIEYKGETISGITLQELKSAIVKSGAKLIKRLQDESPDKNMITVEKLEEFLKKSSVI